MRQYIYCIVFSILFIFSCASKKDIIYIQDSDNLQNFSASFTDYKIKVDDILKIKISVDNPEAALIFSSSLNTNISQTVDSQKYEGYKVDNDGKINYPVIGELLVVNKTVNQVEKEFYDSITESGILIDLSVDIKIINKSFVILGEVNNPGKYEFLKNNMNILEAIGIAGDLTINGRRDNIRIIRDLDNFGKKRTIETIDLTSSNFLQQNFQLFPGDIVIVSPNNNRVKNAGIIGNSGTLLSLLSFILSSIILITNS